MRLMDFLGFGAKIIDKFTPSRKGSTVDRMKQLEADLSDAMAKGQTSKAEALRVQLRDLREKIKYSEGEI